MALSASGLKTYVWNNNLKCVLLLACFPLLLLAMAYGVMVFLSAYSESGTDVGQSLAWAWASMPAAAPAAFVGSGAWFAIAFAGHQAMINASTGATSVAREAEPDLYNMLENLCISRGMPVPKLAIMETDALNAYASGLSDKNYQVAVTRGLMNALEPDELEAVLAHELSHIRHRDVRLMVIAVVFVGIIAFVGEIVFRGMTRGNFYRANRSRRGGGVNAAALLFIAAAIMGLAYVFAMLLRFALSRRREYLADAGAAELTKNPDAMVRALEKVSGRAVVDRAPQEMREMMFENPRAGFGGWLATHPPIEKRIEALQTYAGARTG